MAARSVPIKILFALNCIAGMKCRWKLAARIVHFSGFFFNTIYCFRACRKNRKENSETIYRFCVEGATGDPPLFRLTNPPSAFTEQNKARRSRLRRPAILNSGNRIRMYEVIQIKSFPFSILKLINCSVSGKRLFINFNF